jgi:hypothetical protein
MVMARLSSPKKILLEEYVGDSDIKNESTEKLWRSLEADQRLEIHRIMLLRQLRSFHAQLVLIQKKMIEYLNRPNTPAAVLKNIAIAQGVTVDKVKETEQIVADIEAKLGTNSKVRPKNSINVAS